MTESSPDRQDTSARTPGPLGTAGRQRPPVAVRWAAGLMFAGAALVAGEMAAQIALMKTVSYSGDGGNFFPEAALIFVGIPVTAVECALWVWTGSMALAGRGWARIVSSVFFGGMCLLLIDYIHGFPSPADVTSTGPFIGTVPLVSALPLISGALEWLVGLAAIILIWQRAPSQFYAASGQARAALREPRR
jgi:hypothetical protein